MMLSYDEAKKYETHGFELKVIDADETAQLYIFSRNNIRSTLPFTPLSFASDAVNEIILSFSHEQLKNGEAEYYMSLEASRLDMVGKRMFAGQLTSDCED